VPELAGLAGAAVVFVLLIVLPFVDRSPERNPLRKPVTTPIALVIISGLIVLTVWGAVAA
jgi:quinol-cytochrome oxidoreductase complex cytochrome b subunit